jgi:hypothetical protein
MDLARIIACVARDANSSLDPQAMNQHRLQLSFFRGRAGLAKNR